MKKKLSIKDFAEISSVQTISGDKLKHLKGKGGEDGCPPPFGVFKP